MGIRNDSEAVLTLLDLLVDGWSAGIGTAKMNADPVQDPWPRREPYASAIDAQHTAIERILYAIPSYRAELRLCRVRTPRGRDILEAA